MKKFFEEFKEKVKKSISNIEIGYKEYDDYDYVQIFYYQEKESKNLSEVLGEALGEVFYDRGMYNVGLCEVVEEIKDEYFPFFYYQEEENNNIVDSFSVDFSTEAFNLKNKNVMWFIQKGNDIERKIHIKTSDNIMKKSITTEYDFNVDYNILAA